MEFRDPILQIVRRKSYYAFQKLTRIGIDTDLEVSLRNRAIVYLEKLGDVVISVRPKTVPVQSIHVEQSSRYRVVRDDIYKRFIVDDAGVDIDKFGRRGRWIPRGSMLYLDIRDREYVKVYDEYFCRKGEGRFLKDALEAGLYEFLCPGLSYLIVDESGSLRGYAVKAGRQLTQGEFERYVGRSLRELICTLTEKTGFYFPDLVWHNVIQDGDMLSLIDLESVLPIEWFEKDVQFSLDHIDEIDIGWPIQMKWHSPGWYRVFLRELTA
jgi:hypothetical protein